MLTPTHNHGGPDTTTYRTEADKDLIAPSQESVSAVMVDAYF